jgi:UDP-N-acetylmuramate dehydrogenase
MEVQTSEALAKLYSTCKSEGIACFVLGNGSNLLVDDEGYDGVVLHLGAGMATITREGNDVIAGAGAKLTSLANFARNNSLSGLEFSFGIPGSVGGAAYMKHADCPDGLCVKQRKKSRSGERIVCLPNRVSIEIIGAGEEIL